jgi:hypothetical protein
MGADVGLVIQGREWPLARCRSCKAAVVWAITANEKPMPIDVLTAPDGNIVADGVGRGRFGECPKVRYVKKGEDPGPVPRFTSHFATCPDADDHRR